MNICKKCGGEPVLRSLYNEGYKINCQCGNEIKSVKYGHVDCIIDRWNKENPVEDDNVFTPAYIIKLNGGYVINGVKIVVEVDG